VKVQDRAALGVIKQEQKRDGAKGDESDSTDLPQYSSLPLARLAPATIPLRSRDSP
jgi:hypothetical protein